MKIVRPNYYFSYRNEKLTVSVKDIHTTDKSIDTNLSTDDFGNDLSSTNNINFTYNSDTTFTLSNDLSSSNDCNQNNTYNQNNVSYQDKTKRLLTNTKEGNKSRTK